jgi:hypothetical protein
MWVSCHHGMGASDTKRVSFYQGMGSTQIPYGSEGFQILRVETSFPNKHSLVGDKGGSPAWGLEQSQTIFRSMKPKYYRRYTGHRELGGYFGTTYAT